MGKWENLCSDANDLPVSGVPDPDTCVQTACRDFFPIESNGVDLAEVAGECAQALALGDAPDLRCGIIAARNNNVAVDLQTPDASLVADQHVLADALLQIPDSQCRVSRARDCSISIRHLQTSNSRRVSAERELWISVQ